MTIVIEPMRREDLSEILAIEVASFAVPWTQEMFESELARGDLSEILVARLADAGAPPPVGGYICVWVVSDELHINNIAVDPRWRRRGIAGALLEAALDHGRVRGARRAFLEVRVSNLAAQALYRQYGFEAAGVRRGYYDQPTEDAVIMRRERL
ncbi:MAG: ribosomal protein S18-alanine N-acetyltransferase [candidate division NC10 bacterium]|nr:ribosomal protein S18-alanine N-acetyltransferase [candidate division NC10 bacterium]